MKRTKNTEPVEFTNDQAIDAIYAISDAERQPFAYQKIGRYGLINPGTKDWMSTFEKLGRKTRTREDELNHTSTDEILNRYSGHEDELLDLLSDWSRFAIIIPDYKSAPALVAQFLAEFGGKIDFHTKPDYYAIHWHGNYKDVNTEIQFHTKEFAELKQATDAFYHSYKDVIIEKNSKIEDEYNRQHEEIIKYCQMIYSKSDFMQGLFGVQQVVNEYESRKPKPKAHKKLSHFYMYAKKAEMVQAELAEYFPQFLTKFSQMERTELVHNNEQDIGKNI